MTEDDWIYALLLFLSLFCGYIVISISTISQNGKQYLFSITGLVFALATCRVHILHSFVTSLVNILIIQCAPLRKVPLVSMIWCFAYLSFFRGAESLGLEKPPSFANAIQLILTLKMVGVAYEIHDTNVLEEEISKMDDGPELTQKALQYKYRSVKPSSLDIMLYAYCFVSLFTGPYFKYRTYQDMVERSFQEKNYRKLRTLDKTISKLKKTAVYIPLYMTLSSIYYIEYAETDEFFARTWYYRLWFMVPMFVVFRLRVYVAWTLSEACCVMSGLGAYPSLAKARPGMGPTDLELLEGAYQQQEQEYDFETVHNINEWGCETSQTVREAMKCWNMSVQFWLANFVYKRVPSKSSRTVVTMLVSAYWHGLHGGYYLSFLTIPVWLAAESAMDAGLKPLARNRPRHMQALVFAQTFFKMRMLDYCAMGFLLLKFWATLRYWSSVAFCMHALAVALILGCNFLSLSHRPHPTYGPPDGAVGEAATRRSGPKTG